MAMGVGGLELSFMGMKWTLMPVKSNVQMVGESSHCVAYATRLKADGAPQRNCTFNSVTQSCRCSHQVTPMLKTVNQLRVSISIVLVKLARGPLWRFNHRENNLET
jgi:hypothetical protein